nr:3',5'-cyclic-AMP phosphodiesterase [Cricetibacter osteomyelitidis]
MYDARKNEAKDLVVRFIQITDPHLFKNEDTELLGINTQASFEQVLKEVKQSDFDYDFVLATGDLVQDSSKEAYQRFAEQIKTLGKNVHWIPGNHDFQPTMFEVLNQADNRISAVKHLLAGKRWQIIMLDSQVYGVPHGQLISYQLDWLLSKLKDHPQRYSLIVLHHHIVSTNSEWLDQHNLRNAQELSEVLAPFNNVKGILYGHIHQQVDTQWNGYQVMATPSTCIQFKPDSHHFALDTLQPGWREIELYENGEIKTCVKRIRQKAFLPDFKEEGY